MKEVNVCKKLEVLNDKGEVVKSSRIYQDDSYIVMKVEGRGVNSHVFLTFYKNSGLTVAESTGHGYLDYTIRNKIDEWVAVYLDKDPGSDVQYVQETSIRHLTWEKALDSYKDKHEHIVGKPLGLLNKRTGEFLRCS